MSAEQSCSSTSATSISGSSSASGIEEDANTKDKPQCKFYVTRKKRYCRMTVKKGKDYCGEHQMPSEGLLSEIEEPRTRSRIKCPLDSTHSCYSDNLARHIKKCNARMGERPDYIMPGINAGIDFCVEGDLNYMSSRSLSQIPTNLILSLITTINELYETIKKEICDCFLRHEGMRKEILRPGLGPESLKHLMQTSSLLAHLKQSNLLSSNTCFVEFGAGRGKLSYHLSKCVNNLSGASVLLVERASVRFKADNKLDKSEHRVNRIRADISDLVLNNVEYVQQSSKIVGLAKHLCGEATDFAIRCLVQSNETSGNVDGAILAFCCHHRCQWPSYVGKKYFLDNNLSRFDFDVLCGLVSWATCGTGFSRSRKEEPQKSGSDHDLIDFEGVSRDLRFHSREAELKLTKSEKEAIGRKCKLIIDYGRKKFLELNDFDCSLYYYVASNVTPENVCIVAKKRSN